MTVRVNDRKTCIFTTEDTEGTEETKILDEESYMGRTGTSGECGASGCLRPGTFEGVVPGFSESSVNRAVLLNR